MSKIKRTSLETDIKGFMDSQPWKRTLPSRMRKLGEEYGELAEAVAMNDPEAILQEAADCGILLSDIVSLVGDGTHGLEHEMINKLASRMKRAQTAKEMKETK